MPAATTDPTPNDPRRSQLVSWLHHLDPQLLLRPATLRPASSDASFRRYFRVDIGDPGQGSLIVMDAPPERENVATFVEVGQLFASAGVSVPAVLGADFGQGFLLLSDLGASTYLSALTADTADALYRDALRALVQIQMLPDRDRLPRYEQPVLRRELMLFPEWYLARHLGHAPSESEQQMLEATFRVLEARALAQVQVAVHRDFHSRNLMVLEAGAARGNPGILDFQDAVVGPITYDLVSLLRDAYVVWDEERVLDWCVRYWELARRAGLPMPTDFGEFWRDFEWMGLQRHLKVLGIFARLYHRDSKDNYLKDLPAVLGYTRTVAARYREFLPLLRLLDRLQARAPQVGYTF